LRFLLRRKVALMTELNPTIREHILRRARAICRTLTEVMPDQKSDFYMAGGCLTGRISDIDLFPGETPVPKPNGKIIVSTRNAITYEGPTCPIQVCNYKHNTLQGLVDSFDFAHIQIGVRIQGTPLSVSECYFTNAFVESRALEISWFTGSEYPLASLVRAAKYHKRGYMPRGSYIRVVIDSLAAIVARGFHGYEDFKDQLDAVDLGLVPEEFDDVSKSNLMGLFSALNKE